MQTKGEGLVIAGLDAGKDQNVQIQGSSLVGTRRYHVEASQLATQKIRRLLDKEIDFSNTWLTVTNLLTDDLKTKRTSLNSYMGLSFRHKYFFFNEGVSGESYQNSQFITSLDFKSDWKFW